MNGNKSLAGSSDNENKREMRRQQMLTGPILRLLIKMGIPTVIGMLTATLYNMTDTFFIGWLHDSDMTAAVGVVFSFVSLVQALGFWFGYGSGNVMSRLIGRKNTGEAQIVSSCGIVMSMVVSAVLLAVLLPCIKPLALMLGGGASEKLFVYCIGYLRIMIFAVPFSLYATTVYNQLRLCGNVKDGMIGLMAGMLSNIILDPVLIIGFGLGIEGAGWATLAGQVLGAAVLTMLSFRHGNIPVTLRRCFFSGERIYHILAGGLPNFSRQAITSLALVLLNVSAAGYSVSLIAALTVSQKIAAVGYMVMIGFGQGFQPFCAMNYGAGKYGRVRKGYRITVVIGTAVMCVSAVLLLIFAGQFAGFFSSDPEVVSRGVKILRYQCLSFPLMGVYAISGMYMQNMGFYFRSLAISVARQGYVYIPLLYLLPYIFGESGLYILAPVSDIISAVIGMIIVYDRTKTLPKEDMIGTEP